MDVIQAVLTLVNSGAVIAIYLYVQSREDKMRREARDMHEKQDEQIRKTETKMHHIQTNYNQKFADLRQAVMDGKIEMLRAIQEMEKTLRDSNHRLAEEIHKFMLGRSQ
jgi:hypothetical protein